MRGAERNQRARKVRTAIKLAALVFVGILVLLNLNSVYADTGAGAFEYKLQTRSNYCGIALMQSFIPELSQNEIASLLRKGEQDLTYWGDFAYIFNKYGVAYHWSSLKDEFPAVVLLDARTFGLTNNHYVVVLGERHNFYKIFDPKKGFYKKPVTYLEGSRALVIDQGVEGS